MPPPAVLAKREHEFTPVPFLLEVKGSIVQFHLFEYEMSREFVRGKSWGHEPRPDPYSGLLSCFPMLGWAKWVGKVDCTLLTFFIFISRFREQKSCEFAELRLNGLFRKVMVVSNLQ
jgi:hypothetical protein